MMNSRSLHMCLIVVPTLVAMPLLNTVNAAAQSIAFIHGGLGASTNVNGAFNINLPATGSITTVYTNTTGKTIKDFHFTWTNNQAGVTGEDDKGGDPSVYFGSYTPGAKSFDFFD